MVFGAVVLTGGAALTWQHMNTPVVAQPPSQSAGLIPAQATKPKTRLAHNFTLKNLDGKNVTLSDYRGKKVVVLDFWATWCGPCRMTMPALESFQVKHRKRLEVLSINQLEDPQRVAAYINNQSYESLHVLLDQDGRVSREYRVYGIPTLYVINLEGVMCYKHVGYRPGLGAHLEEAIAQHCNVKL